MTARAVGAKANTSTLPLSRLSDWVTVWSDPVWWGPRQQAIVAYLKAEGYPARAQGHYIQTFPDDVTEVAEIIKNWTKED